MKVDQWIRTPDCAFVRKAPESLEPKSILTFGSSDYGAYQTNSLELDVGIALKSREFGGLN